MWGYQRIFNGLLWSGDIFLFVEYIYAFYPQYIFMAILALKLLFIFYHALLGMKFPVIIIKSLFNAC